jgi:arylsulfatase A-like enzyme
MPLRTAWLGDHFFQAISDFGVFVAQKFEIGPFRAAEQSFFASQFIVDPRKDAASINRAFLDWLNARKQPSRPFFAFLNFYDAHAPYMLPAGARYRFGLTPRKPADFEFLVDGWDTVDRLELRPIYRQLASDSYDNCLAYLDERLGELLEELRLRGVLDQTLVIVTADHGEGFGEHGLFDHGESLYRSEVRVPLLIVLPAGRRFTGSVPQPVSLLDVPATIVDVVGTAERSPFAGHSLAEFWNRQTPLARRSSSPREAFSELPSPNPYNPNRGRSPAQNGPLTALASDDYVYIRNDGDGSEELFDARQDPAEAHNLARTGAVADVLTRLRDRLERMKKGGK